MWPRPPIVGQLVDRLPDGGLDPASTTDCGEACMSSALKAVKQVDLPVGCIRFAYGLPSTAGYSSANDHWLFWRRVGGRAHVLHHYGNALWDELRMLRMHSRYVLLLGNWLSPRIEHWVLAYERDASNLHVMGPYDGIYCTYPREHVLRYATGAHVALQ